MQKSVSYVKQLGPKPEECFFCPILTTKLGRWPSGRFSAWVNLANANIRDEDKRGWKKRPGFGKLFFDFASDRPTANRQCPDAINEQATALIAQADTVRINCPAYLPSDAVVIDYAWLAVREGHRRTCFKIRAANMDEARAYANEEFGDEFEFHEDGKDCFVFGDWKSGAERAKWMAADDAEWVEEEDRMTPEEIAAEGKRYDDAMFWMRFKWA